MVFESCWRRLFMGTAVVLGVVAMVLAAWAWSLPRIAVGPTSQDLGEKPQQHIELTYVVRNQGRSLLRIEEITTTCACTKAKVEQETVAPGESTLLRVTMDPQHDNLYGNLFRVITVRTNDPIEPRTQVDFRVRIYKPDG